MQCLDENTVLRLVSGALAAALRPEVERHLDECAGCRRLVSWAKATSAAASTTPTLPPAAGEAPPAASRELLPGATLGRYVVLSRLGAGGMGVVYLAYDPKIDRRIALKLIRAEGHGAQAVAELKQRLLREARAMARASHPDVIAVHDAGEAGEHVFVAMEYIEGSTLSVWMAAGRRQPREVLALFLRVGRALEAAHRAGLVHRDFKPDNVLVGRDGRVRVTDFGLARLPEELAKDAAPSPEELAAKASSITRPGAIVGSPAYMAPEQMDGARADQRADLFSYSVALFEALAGQRPFAGNSLYELREAIRQARLRPEAMSRVPAWLRRPLARGLQADPAQRWQTMGELLAQLERDPGRTLRRMALGAGALLCLGAAAAGIVSVRRHRASLCSGAERRLAGTWDDARRAQVGAAFTATKAPFAADALAQVQQLLDGRSRDWAAMHREACEATRVRGEQSEELLDLRMACLDQRLAEERALVSLFSAADRKMVGRAVQAAQALSPASVCADGKRLKAEAHEPAGPALRARVAQLRASLAQAKALKDVARYRDADALLTSALGPARELGYKPLTGELALLQGTVLDLLGDLPRALALLREAAAAGFAGGRDDVAAKALMRLSFIQAESLGRPAEARQWIELAAAALERLGADDELWGIYEHELSSVFAAEGNAAEAIAHARRGLALRERALGKDNPALTRALDKLATALCNARLWQECADAFARSVALGEKGFGPRHPVVAQALSNMVEALANLGRVKEAIGVARRALDIREATVGRESFDYAVNRHNLGELLFEDGQREEGLALVRLGVPAVDKLAPKSPFASLVRSDLGRMLLDTGKLAEALPLLEQAVAMRESEAGHHNLGYSRFLLARALWESGQDRPRARKLAARAREELAADKSPDLPKLESWLASL